MPLSMRKRRIVFFLDGASRATLIPFAPFLISVSLQHATTITTTNDNGTYQADPNSTNALVDHHNDPNRSTWAHLSFITSVMVATYLLGRALGQIIGNHRKVKCLVQHKTSNNATETKKGNKVFASAVGAILSLQFFSFGFGYNHGIVIIWLIRFCMGLLNGFIQQITDTFTPSTLNKNNRTSSNFNHDNKFWSSMLESGMIKRWLIGFGISSLSSGILFHPIHNSDFYTVLSNVKHSSWSWIVLTLIFGCFVIVSQFVLDFWFSFTESSTPAPYSREGEMYTTSHLLKRRRSGSGIIMKGYKTSSSSATTACQANIACSTNFHNVQEHQNVPYNNRVRLGSNMSNISDVFFDCESDVGISFDEYNVHSDDTSIVPGNLSSVTSGLPSANHNQQQHQQNLITWEDNSHSIAKYENGKCIFDNGAPAHVPPGCSPSTVPLAYQKCFKSNASNKWEATKKWRMDEKIYKVHATPHSLFPRIKQAYPHFIHGYSKLGYPVVYEQPFKMKLKEMFREGHTVDDMIHHYKFFLEYMSNVLCYQRQEIKDALEMRPEEEKNLDWGFVIVMDLSGISLSALTLLSGSVLQYLQKAGVVNNNHYPDTITQGVLINAPFWVSGVFDKIKPLVPTSANADLVSAANVTTGLRKYIDDDQIPNEFGGSSPYALSEHPYELELNNLVKQSLERDEEEDIDFYPVDEADKSNEMGVNEEPLYNNEEKMVDLEANTIDSNSRSYFIPETPSYNTVAFVDDEFSTPASTQSRSAQDADAESEFLSISIIYWFLCSIHGALEVILPQWLLIPRALGGLNYSVEKCGISFFVSTITLSLLLPSNRLKRISTLPNQLPLTGVRVGEIVMALLLIILPLIPWFLGDDHVIVVSFNIFAVIFLIVSIMVGRMSSARIHSIAALTYLDKLSLSCDDRTILGRSINIFANHTRNGGLTWMLGVSGEIIGALFSSLLIRWSLDTQIDAPFHDAFPLYSIATISLTLYVISFYLKIHGESLYNSHRGSNICVILTVASSDIAFMFGRHGSVRGEARSKLK